MLGDLARRDPDGIALRDQPERATWSGRAARVRSWAKLHEDTGRLSVFLAGLRLDPGARVVVCLPNCSEGILAVLALERAGLTPCLLPLVTEPGQVAATVEAVNARALITQALMGAERPAADLAPVAAADFRLRFLLGFGPDLPDGVLDLDGVLEESGAVPERPSGNAAPAMLTVAGGGRVVARSSASLVAAAAPVLAATGAKSRDRIASFVAADDLKGLATGLAQALMSGASLELYEVASRAALENAVSAPGRLHLVLPGWAESALPSDTRPSGSLLFASDAPVRLPGRHPAPAPTLHAVSLAETALLVFGEDRTQPPGSRPPFLDVEIDPGGTIRTRGVGVVSEEDESGMAPTGAGTALASKWIQTDFRLEFEGGAVAGVA
jgi:hypothetical protein